MGTRVPRGKVFYAMKDGITLCGMDATGEMTSWYVFNALGLYP